MFGSHAALQGVPDSGFVLRPQQDGGQQRVSGRLLDAGEVRTSSLGPEPLLQIREGLRDWCTDRHWRLAPRRCKRGRYCLRLALASLHRCKAAAEALGGLELQLRS